MMAVRILLGLTAILIVAMLLASYGVFVLVDR